MIEYELVFDDKKIPLDADSIRTKTLVEELLCGRHAVSRDDDGPRKRFARDLIRIFTGDLRKEIKHHCLGRHCCPNGRASAVESATDVIMDLLERRVDVPALNRWLTVFPVVRCSLCFLCCIGSFLERRYYCQASVWTLQSLLVQMMILGVPVRVKLKQQRLGHRSRSHIFGKKCDAGRPRC